MNIKNPIIKKVLIIILIPLAIFLLLIIYTAGKNIWGGYKWQKATEEFQESLERPYKEDVYGGKTPEETWTMFLDTLKKGDLELASKYYDAGHQDKAKEWLEKLKQNDELEQTIKEMEGLRKSERKSLENQANYYYNYYDQEFKQELSSIIIFYFNPYTKVWKIIW
ncbi:MAG: hypothetical protein AAB474_00305 [Patescibacteria group bacterium]